MDAPTDNPSVPIQDLSADSFIANAPQIELDGRRFRALGGIPLLARLGQGGMGAVYYGIHPRLKKEVAVKVLPFHLAERNPDFISRFYREAQIAANIQSPNLVNVLDVNAENGLSYLVMEYVNGQTAGAHLKELKLLNQRELPEVAALEICIAATRGLAAAHAEGVIHRDIKPDNILIPRKRNSEDLNFTAAKLSDLGLAQSENSVKSETETGDCIGTPGYMSPEQSLDAKKCGPASDIFGMGVTLYALLSGYSPFRPSGSDSSLMQVMLDTCGKAHAPIQSIRAEVSDSTAALLDKALAKSPAERHAGAAELLKALETCRAALTQTDQGLPELFQSPTVRRPSVALLSVPPIPPETMRVKPLPPAKNSSGTLVAAIAVFLLAALLIYVAYFKK